MLDSPSIPRNNRARIVLVAYSVGGLVNKSTYVLAQLKNEFDLLASRIHSIFLLATPRHGADLAQLRIPAPCYWLRE